MARIHAAVSELGALDDLASLDSPVHRLDPRAKVLVTAAFLVTAVSFPKCEIAELMPLCLYPVVLLSAGRVPLQMLARTLLLASPFAVMAGMFNPLLDREIAARWGALEVTGGWLSFFSILIRFALTASAALILLACTGYASVCAALGRLGAPRVLVAQFLLLYRFLFLLAGEAARMSRAHALRSGTGRRPSIREWGGLAGNLLLRAFDRGSRVHAAMLVRGFDGTLPETRPMRWTAVDTAFVGLCLAFFALARFGHPAERLGRFLLETIG